MTIATLVLGGCSGNNRQLTSEQARVAIISKYKADEKNINNVYLQLEQVNNNCYFGEAQSPNRTPQGYLWNNGRISLAYIAPSKCK